MGIYETMKLDELIDEKKARQANEQIKNNLLKSLDSHMIKFNDYIKSCEEIHTAKLETGIETWADYAKIEFELIKLLASILKVEFNIGFKTPIDTMAEQLYKFYK